MKKLVTIFIFCLMALPATAQLDFKTAKALAEKGDADAQLTLAIMYGSGKGVAQDSVESLKWYHKAAEQDHVQAQFFLGSKYYLGDNIEQDYGKAEKWFVKAGTNGHAMAQYELGVMYNEGKGVTINHEKVVKWHGKAAQQGHANAQLNLGIMHVLGRGGLPQNPPKGYIFVSMAKSNGSPNASPALEFLNGKLTQDEIAKATNSAKKCYESDYKNCDGLFGE